MLLRTQNCSAPSFRHISLVTTLLLPLLSVVSIPFLSFSLLCFQNQSHSHILDCVVPVLYLPLPSVHLLSPIPHILARQTYFTFMFFLVFNCRPVSPIYTALSLLHGISYTTPFCFKRLYSLRFLISNFSAWFENSSKGVFCRNPHELF